MRKQNQKQTNQTLVILAALSAIAFTCPMEANANAEATAKRKTGPVHKVIKRLKKTIKHVTKLPKVATQSAGDYDYVQDPVPNINGG